MRRLWVRLSVLIGGLLLAVVLLLAVAVFADSMLDPHTQAPEQQFQRPPPDERSPNIAGVTLRLVGMLALIGVVGAGAGVIASRVVSAPITELAAAARRIGAGDLGVRVRAHGSQELEELGQAFNHMAADLQHAETLRRHLMADVSHELRTPLTVLEGNLRAALDRVYPLDESGIANLYGQTHHLIRLVNDLRELALAEAHQLPLQMQTIDVGELADEVVQVFAPLADEQGVRLTLAACAPSLVAADPLRLRQVLDNLLSNALRHTPPGGTVTVTVASVAEGVQLSVRDSGDGLTAEQQALLFDRFYRADRSRSRATGGSGLGLAIVKALVEAHGGRIAVHSAGLNAGSTFTVALPRAPLATAKVTGDREQVTAKTPHKADAPP